MKNRITILGLILTLLVSATVSGCSSSAPASKSKTIIEYWHINAETVGGNTIKTIS